VPLVGENTSVFTGNHARLQCPISATVAHVHIFFTSFMVFHKILSLVHYCSLLYHPSRHFTLTIWLQSIQCGFWKDLTKKTYKVHCGEITHTGSVHGWPCTAVLVYCSACGSVSQSSKHYTISTTRYRLHC